VQLTHTSRSFTNSSTAAAAAFPAQVHRQQPDRHKQGAAAVAAATHETGKTRVMLFPGLRDGTLMRLLPITNTLLLVTCCSRMLVTRGPARREAGRAAARGARA
jgi:hypothetical protein